MGEILGSLTPTAPSKRFLTLTGCTVTLPIKEGWLPEAHWLIALATDQRLCFTLPAAEMPRPYQAILYKSINRQTSSMVLPNPPAPSPALSTYQKVGHKLNKAAPFVPLTTGQKTSNMCCCFSVQACQKWRYTFRGSHSIRSPLSAF